MAFRGLLRTGELLAVKAADIMFAHNNAKAFVQLHESKTMRTNPATRLAISDYKVVTLLRAWKASVPGTASLVPMPPHQFRKAYGLALANANLGSYGFKPYSLRRGGATELFLTCHSFSTVTQHGRWASERTARIYIQYSLALLTEQNFRMNAAHRKFYSHWQHVSSLEPPKRINRGRGRVH